MSLRILGQKAPDATTETDLYSVPTSTQTVISTIVATNRGGTDTTFRISIAKKGETTSDKQYLYYDLPLPANDVFALTFGISLSSLDVIRVYAGNANLSFSAFGEEIKS